LDTEHEEDDTRTVVDDSREPRYRHERPDEQRDRDRRTREMGCNGADAAERVVPVAEEPGEACRQRNPRESGNETQSANRQHTPRLGAELYFDVGVRAQERDRGVTQPVKEHCERVTDDYRHEGATPVVETVSDADFDH
jgi:hypothetical protein